MNFLSQKLARTYYQCLEFVITTPFSCSFLLTLALKSMTCVMASWFWPNPSMIKI